MANNEKTNKNYVCFRLKDCMCEFCVWDRDIDDFELNNANNNINKDDWQTQQIIAFTAFLNRYLCLSPPITIANNSSYNLIHQYLNLLHNFLKK